MSEWKPDTNDSLQSCPPCRSPAECISGGCALQRRKREALEKTYEPGETPLKSEERAIVDRVWNALAIATYEEANGKTIDEHVAGLRREVAELREAAKRVLNAHLLDPNYFLDHEVTTARIEYNESRAALERLIYAPPAQE